MYSTFNAARDFALACIGAPFVMVAGMSGLAYADILTPLGREVFSELWEWFKVFAAICMALGIAWVVYALIRERFRPAIPDQQHEYERDV